MGRGGFYSLGLVADTIVADEICQELKAVCSIIQLYVVEKRWL